MRLRHILCPIDFSEPAREAMHTAMGLAGPDACVTLLHVHDLSFAGSPTFPRQPALVDAITADADHTLRAWAAEAPALGPARVEACSVQGVVWSNVVEMARRCAADLVVIGTHGRTGLRHALLGSVAERVLRHAGCPVLVVRGARP